MIIQLPDQILNFVSENPSESLIIVLTVFIILVTEVWRVIKKLVSKLLRVILSKLFGFSNNLQDKKSVPYTNLNEVQSTDVGSVTSSPTLPGDIKFQINKDNYLEVKEK